MSTFETIAIVAVVYVLAFLAHRTAGRADQSAQDDGTPI